MCGISGFYSTSQKLQIEKYYSSHCKIAHRGPDDEGFYCLSDGDLNCYYGDDTIEEKKNNAHILSLESSSLILGHRRLSIIDLTSAGHQPFLYKELSLVYNGEIFNYIELREELIELGYEFKTESDTEVFIKSFHCWGVGAFNRFNGMWAAAIYNAQSKELILTRDRFGIKPLYYLYDDDTNSINFCSEIKGLVDFLSKRILNLSCAYSYLRFCHLSHNDETFFEGIMSVTPGSYLTLSDDIKATRYYEAPSHEGDIESLLKSAVQLRARADTELGLLLSGGIDSSTLSALLREEKPDEKIKTFTADFDESEFSERQYVEMTLAQEELEGHYVKLQAREFEVDMEDFLRTHEYPVRSLSAYIQYKIFEYVKSETDVKVTFSGQGADEIFSGYTKDYYIYLASIFKQGNIIGFFKLMKTFRTAKGWAYSSMFKNALVYLGRCFYLPYDPYNIFMSKVKYTKEPVKSGKLLKAYQRKNILFSALREYFRREDRNSMKFSIESRLPFMDYRLVEAGLALEESRMIKDGISKFELRKVATGKIPDQILNRKDKMGFITPQVRWQKVELSKTFDETFSAIRKSGLGGFLNGQKVYEHYLQYKQGKFNDWAFIWRCYCLYHYVRVWGLNK